MANWDDVRRIALSLPETSEGTSYDGVRAWRVNKKLFVWERPLRKADIVSLGEGAPDGPIVAVRVSDLGVKDVLCAAAPELYFTTPHFDGYPAILIRLVDIDAGELEELIVEAWLERAPKKLASTYLSTERDIPRQPPSPTD